MGTLTSPVLVGRADEMARLVSCLESAPAVAVVEGEAGVGKSRLVAELVSGPGRGPQDPAGGHCHPKILSLTPREVQVLQHLAKGRPLKETAAELCLAVGTVKNLTSRVVSKLGVRSQLEAVTLAGDAGFLW